MKTTNQPRVDSVDELRRHCPQLDAARVVDSLSVGLSRVRNLLLKRVHEDVERHDGIDSLIAPVSRVGEQRQTRTAKLEIEIYSAIVTAEEAAQSGYVDDSPEWFLDWMVHLRLGGELDIEQLVRRRKRSYRSPTAEARRLKFLSLLQQAMPESARTPLVLFRLFPRAVRIAAAVAFGDMLRAQELRAEQCSFLPAITDCSECHGRVLDNEDSCLLCGNPVWEFEWLKSD